MIRKRNLYNGYFCFWLLFGLLFSGPAFSQNWPTFGGGSSRGGASKITGPQSVINPYWTVNSTNTTTLGNAVYTFGDRFVTSRVQFSPYTGLVECRDLQSGSLLWTSPFISATSILYVIGFTEDGVYAHDYNTDTIYSLRPDNGSIRWRSKVKSQTFGAYPGCVFACNGDLIVNGPLATGKFTMRLDKNTGDTLWTNSVLIAIGPAVGLAANESKVYRITGGITLPILLTAIDINTGTTLYSSTPIPGDPDQENPITIGRDNEIYFWRDNGNLYRYNDTNNALVQDWSYVPLSTSGAALSGDISIGLDDNIYVFNTGRIRRINYINGVQIDTSVISVGQGTISVGFDSTVYVNDKNGNFYALSPDLQTIKWQIPVGGNTYCNPALAKDGIMVLTGAGTQIRAYAPTLNIPPVADFRASTTKATVGLPVDFFDQSSYIALSWQWEFPGATVTSSNAQNPAGIIYNATGIYEVSLVAQNQWGVDSITKTCYLEVVSGIGISTISDIDSDIIVYPNPAREIFQLKVPTYLIDTGIEITDALGRSIYKCNIPSATSTVDVTNFSPATYLIRFSGCPDCYKKLTVVGY